MAKTRFTGFGLTGSQFFNSLSDHELRRFLDPGVLSVLDAIFDGQVEGEDLRRIAQKLVDLEILIGDSQGRRLVLQLVPDEKKPELESYVERNVGPSDADKWTDAEVRRMRDFFALDEERVVPAAVPPTEPITACYGLFEHQRNAVRRLKPLLTEDERRAVLHLPTGVGKTRTAMHIVCDVFRTVEPSVVVWLASGKELLEQAVFDFKQAWKHLGNRPLQIGTMWGERTPDLNSFSDGFLAVGLAKGWAMISRIDPDWASRLSRRVRLVVFDEAHQSIARTHRWITDDLTLDYRCALLGLTATPGRTWADIDKDGQLADFFCDNKVTLDVPEKNPIKYLIKNEYLAQPVFRTLLSEPGISINDSELNRIAGLLDIPLEIVSSLSISKQYIAAVLGAIVQLLQAGHRRILVFAATVDQAQMLTAILVARDIRSEVVTAVTPVRIRDSAIRSFKADDDTPMVLVNYGVLTTGFDAPKASAAVIARPTKSLVLYSQMVGRVIRGPKAGGTKTCEILTVVDPSLPGFGDVAKAFLNWEDVWQ